MGKRRKVQILDWSFWFIPIEERKDIYDYYFVEVLCLIHEEAESIRSFYEVSMKLIWIDILAQVAIKLYKNV